MWWHRNAITQSSGGYIIWPVGQYLNSPVHFYSLQLDVVNKDSQLMLLCLFSNSCFLSNTNSANANFHQISYFTELN